MSGSDRNFALATALAPPGMVAYKKSGRNDEEDFNLNTKSKSKKQPTPPKEDGFQSESNKKGGGKFVPLFAKDGKVDENVMILPGRNPCRCQAQKHELINNCLKCGRIVCKQEGSGPCLFCGNLVCTKDQLEVLNRGSKKSEQLMKKLTSIDANQAKAEKHKNTLLEYDRTSEKRTQVIDDESDYFSIEAEKWMTKEQRNKLKQREKEVWEQRHGSRLNKKYNFDFAGRKVVEDVPSIYDPNQDEQLRRILEQEPERVLQSLNLENIGVANPNIKMRPEFVQDSSSKKEMTKSSLKIEDNKHLLRIQDASLQEMRDDGWCMSMHQPWASYLVAGVKIHEGRNWYSPHRGRLWIHAAAKVPSDEETQSLQHFYQSRSKKEIEFPDNLPVSCLLGCVDVVDVLAQEEYREKFPNGESSSPFVFVCTNPQELMIKFPMSGQHKIYKLDPNIHNAAKKSGKKANSN